MASKIMSHISQWMIPAPAVVKETAETACPCSSLLFLEYDEEVCVAARQLQQLWETVGLAPLRLQPGRRKQGPTRRIRLQVSTDAPKNDGYRLEIKSDSVTIVSATSAGVFYGTQSLMQIIAGTSLTGGLERLLPAGIIEDTPRFPWRGVMLDCARHYQPRQVILELLATMAHYKFNRFHWHLTDRQGWRIPVKCAPELIRPLPDDRCYSHGTYSLEDIRAIQKFAREHHIVIVPEIDMPGHSAVVFRSHPDLACPNISSPFQEDVWEFCLANPDGRQFLKTVIQELCDIFPDSPWIHLGGDEASDKYWKECPRCTAALKSKHLDNFHELTLDLLQQVNEVLEKNHRRAILWDTGLPGQFPKDFHPIMQNYLKKNASHLTNAGFDAINSSVMPFYADYPLEPGDDDALYLRNARNADLTYGTNNPSRIYGGEICVWTEKLPPWRMMTRLLPRLRHASEAFWSPKKKSSYTDFLRRERALVEGLPMFNGLVMCDFL